MASISWLRSMISATKAKISKNENSIERLKTAKNQMSAVKDEFQIIRNSEKKVFNDNYRWKGQQYKNFLSWCDNLDNYNAEYCEKLDRSLDSINSKITELQNENLSVLFPKLSWLIAQLNAALAELENALN